MEKNNEINDWEDVPVEQNNEIDDWQDIPHEVTESKGLDRLISAINPLEETKQEIYNVGQTALDAAQGLGQGRMLGSADELGGALSAGIETALGWIPGTDANKTVRLDEKLRSEGYTIPEDTISDKYRSSQQAIERHLDEAQERSPWAYGGANLVGGIQSGNAVQRALGLGSVPASQKLLDIAKQKGLLSAGGELLKRGATEFAKAAPVMGVESALLSKQNLFGADANPQGVASDVGESLTLGGLVMGAGQVAQDVASPAFNAVKSKISDLVSDASTKRFTSENNPKLRQLARAFNEYGKKLDINPSSHAEDIKIGGLAQNDSNEVLKIQKMFDDADDKLGKRVGDSLTEATERGDYIPLNPIIERAEQNLKKLATEIPGFGDSYKSGKADYKMTKGERVLTPIQVKYLIDDIDNSISIFKNANKGPAEAATLRQLYEFREGISTSLKNSVPDYAEASKNFQNFRNVRESVISGKKPSSVTDVFYGRIRNPDEKEYDKLLDIIAHSQETGQAAEKSRTAFGNMFESLEDFQSKYTGKNPVLPDVKTIRADILRASDDSALRRDSKNTTESKGFYPKIEDFITGKLPITGAYLAGSAVKRAGELVKKPIVTKIRNIPRDIMRAPIESQYRLASKLEASGNAGLSTLGKTLRGSLDKGDTDAAKRVAFIIGQNPYAKIYVDEEPQNEEQE